MVQRILMPVVTEFATVILRYVFFVTPDLTSLAHSCLTLNDDSTVSHSTLRNNFGVELMTRQNLMATDDKAGQNLTRKFLVAFT